MNECSAFVFASLLLLSGCDDSGVTGPVSSAGATPLHTAVTKLESPWTA